MKARLPIIASVVISLAALGYAAWLHHRMDSLAEQALARREAALVAHWAPRLEAIYDALADPSHGVRPSRPTSFEDVFDVFVTILDALPVSEDPKAPLTE